MRQIIFTAYSRYGNTQDRVKRAYIPCIIQAVVRQEDVWLVDIELYGWRIETWVRTASFVQCWAEG